MNLPFDTTVHYVAAHLHPCVESLELRDLNNVGGWCSSGIVVE
jgi:hypothetical protein